MLLLEYYTNYMLSIKNRSQGTTEGYKRDILEFYNYINTIKPKKMDVEKFILEKVDLNVLHNFIKSLSNISSTTKARKIASLKSFYKYLVLSEHTNNNPTINLEAPKQSKRRLPVYMSLEEANTLMNNIADIRDKAIITVFLNTGIRLSELVNLDMNTLKLDEGYFRVIGKGDKERIVHMNQVTSDAIKNYLEIRPYTTSKALFLSNRKERINQRSVQNILKKYLNQLELNNKYSIHKLRHTSATLMYQYGDVDIKTLQEILGHESIATTQIYTHVDTRQLKKAVDVNPLNVGGKGNENL